jgi:hypothetical protein
MGLQCSGTVNGVNRALQIYIDVLTAGDSQFPLCPGDEYVVRVVDEAVVITQPDYDPDSLDLPDIDSDVLSDQ